MKKLFVITAIIMLLAVSSSALAEENDGISLLVPPTAAALKMFGLPVFPDPSVTGERVQIMVSPRDGEEGYEVAVDFATNGDEMTASSTAVRSSIMWQNPDGSLYYGQSSLAEFVVPSAGGVRRVVVAPQVAAATLRPVLVTSESAIFADEKVKVAVYHTDNNYVVAVRFLKEDVKHVLLKFRCQTESTGVFLYRLMVSRSPVATENTVVREVGLVGATGLDGIEAIRLVPGPMTRVLRR